MEYILVTGAYGGMGQAAVDKLVKSGYCVFAMDKEVKSARTGVIPLKADITNTESVTAAFEKVRDITNRLYAIVHFAGIYMLDSLIEADAEKYKRAFDVNLFGAFTVNKIFYPLLNKGSRILITTSELSMLDPLPFTGIYAITKCALDRYAYSLRMELQLHKISVSVLRAGAVDTGMLKVSTNALDNFCENTRLYACNAARFKKIVDGVEAKRIPAEKIAVKAVRILKQKSPRFSYSINRNPLLIR